MNLQNISIILGSIASIITIIAFFINIIRKNNENITIKIDSSAKGKNIKKQDTIILGEKNKILKKDDIKGE